MTTLMITTLYKKQTKPRSFYIMWASSLGTPSNTFRMATSVPFFFSLVSALEIEKEVAYTLPAL